MHRERRKHVRRKMQYRAQIAIADEGPSHSCVVRDIAAGGARIVLDHALNLPEKFALVLSGNSSVHRQCRIVWRSAREAGVIFLPSPCEWQTDLVLAEPAV
jgi:PilZ domain